MKIFSITLMTGLLLVSAAANSAVRAQNISNLTEDLSCGRHDFADTRIDVELVGNKVLVTHSSQYTGLVSGLNDMQIPKGLVLDDYHSTKTFHEFEYEAQNCKQDHNNPILVRCAQSIVMVKKTTTLERDENGKWLNSPVVIQEVTEVEGLTLWTSITTTEELGSGPVVRNTVYLSGMRAPSSTTTTTSSRYVHLNDQLSNAYSCLTGRVQ